MLGCGQSPRISWLRGYFSGYSSLWLSALLWSVCRVCCCLFPLSFCHFCNSITIGYRPIFRPACIILCSIWTLMIDVPNFACSVQFDVCPVLLMTRLLAGGPQISLPWIAMDSITASKNLCQISIGIFRLIEGPPCLVSQVIHCFFF